MSEYVLGNPEFKGNVVTAADRWVFGMRKMGYVVTKDMMPKPGASFWNVDLMIDKEENGLIYLKKKPIIIDSEIQKNNESGPQIQKSQG